MKIGVNQTLMLASGMDRTDVTAMLTACENTGINWLRTQFNWEWFEKTKGTFYWDAADFALNLANEKGINILGILTGAPLWANGNKANYPPTDLPAWSNFANRVQARYPQVTWWEIFNEQNTNLWQPKPNYINYMAVLKATPKLHGNKFLCGGYAGIPHLSGDKTHFENCLKNGMADLIDGIAYHPYPTTFPIAWTFFNKDPKETYALKYLKEVKAIVAKYTLKPMEYWLTELGHCTAGLWPWQTTSEQNQKDYWVRMRNSYAGAGVDALMYFDLWEMAEPGSASAMWAVNHYGIFYHDFTPKPIVEVFLP